MKTLSFSKFPALFLFISSFFLINSGSTLRSSDRFYVSTDKTFRLSEFPYLHLEGNGRLDYEVRIYEVKDPEAFLRKEVKNRVLQTHPSEISANPFQLLGESWDYFKEELRSIARAELTKDRTMLQKALALEYGSSKKRPLASLKPLPYPVLTSFSLPAVDESWIYRRVDLPLSDAGCYLVEVVSGGLSAKTVIIKSNITFLVKQADQQTLLYAANRESGEPLAGANILAIERLEGKELFTGKTNREGIFQHKGTSSNQSLVLVNKGKDFAISDPNFFSRSFYGQGGLRAYLYTDRSVYRPGDEVNVKGMVRNFQRGDYLSNPLKGKLLVYGPKSEDSVLETDVNISSDYGTFNANFKIPKDQGDMGLYNLKLVIGKKNFAGNFYVEYYKKPRFQVSLKTDNDLYTPGESILLNIQASYNYGAPVKKKKCKLRIFRTPLYKPSPVGRLSFFENASQYLAMESPGVSELVLEKELTLNDQGAVLFTMPDQTIDKDYTYRALATVYDGQGSVSAGKALKLVKGEFYIQALREKMIFVPGEPVRIGAKVMPYKTKTAFEVKPVLIEARVLRKKFTNISSQQPGDLVAKKKIATGQGLARFNFKIIGSGHYTVIFTAKDELGSLIESVTELWISGKADQVEQNFSSLRLRPDKDFYELGDKAKIQVSSPASAGKLFYTLEAQNIMKSDIIELAANQQILEIPITKQMTPNFTLFASMVYQGQIYKQQVSLAAPPIDKLLNVAIKPSRADYEPGDEVELLIKVRDSAGKPVKTELSLAVVDEAIFQLRQPINPSLSNYFYHPRRNNVQTSYSDSYRFFGYSSTAELKLAKALDGSSPMAVLKPGKRDYRGEFKDTAFWQANLMTDSQGQALTKFKLPQNITKWRVTTLAVSKKFALGEASAFFTASRKLMLLTNVPEFLYKDKEQSVGVMVANNTNAPIEAKLHLDLDSGEVLDQPNRDLTLQAGDQKAIYYKIKPGNIDSVDLAWTASGGGFSDAVMNKIPLRLFGQQEYVSKIIPIAKGEKSLENNFQLPESAVDTMIRLSFSPGIGLPVKASLDFLADYPYGCIEQTMSRFVPLIAAKQAGFISKRLEKELPAMIDKGLASIRNQQNSNGGFRWMSQSGDSDPVMSAYVHFALSRILDSGNIEARRLYYSSKNYVGNQLRTNSSLKPEARAQLLLAQSQTRKIDKSMIDVLAKSGEVQPGPLAYLYAKSGFTAESDVYLAQGLEKIQGIPWLMKTSNPNLNADPIENAAWLLMTGILLNKDPLIKKIPANFLLQNRTGLAWDNSRNSALAVLALSDLLKQEKESLESLDFQYAINKATPETIKLDAKSLYDSPLVQELNKNQVVNGTNNFAILSNQGMDIFATLELNYFNTNNNPKEVNNGYSVKRTYSKLVAKKEKEKVSYEAKVATSFNAGDLVMAELRVFASDPGEYIQVEEPLIPGFSIIENDFSFFNKSRPLEFQTKTKTQDKIVFFREEAATDFTIRYFFYAVLPGKHAILPARAQRMYYPYVYGTSKTDKITIRSDS